jgi:hypothetical protein
VKDAFATFSHPGSGVVWSHRCLLGAAVEFLWDSLVHLLQVSKSMIWKMSWKSITLIGTLAFHVLLVIGVSKKHLDRRFIISHLSLIWQ